MKRISEAARETADWMEAHPQEWTKGTMARKDSGWEADPESEEAVKWCAVGWMQKTYGKEMMLEVRKKFVNMFGKELVDYNDDSKIGREGTIKILREFADSFEGEERNSVN